MVGQFLGVVQASKLDCVFTRPSQNVLMLSVVRYYRHPRGEQLLVNQSKVGASTRDNYYAFGTCCKESDLKERP